VGCPVIPVAEMESIESPQQHRQLSGTPGFLSDNVCRFALANIMVRLVGAHTVRPEGSDERQDGPFDDLLQILDNEITSVV
jgi:hypothetical protein